MGSINALVASLRQFESNATIIKEVRGELRQPVPIVRARIKAVAVATLPESGGLGDWVAGTRITAQVTMKGRAAGIRLRGGRNSKGSRSDIKAIDRGRVRHPSWGRRSRGNWHTQDVIPGFFTDTAAQAPEWAAAIDRAVTVALGSIHA